MTQQAPPEGLGAGRKAVAAESSPSLKQVAGTGVSEA